VPANILLVKNTTLHGTFWGSYMQHQPALVDEGMRQVLSWIGEGRIKLEISHRWDSGACALLAQHPMCASSVSTLALLVLLSPRLGARGLRCMPQAKSFEPRLAPLPASCSVLAQPVLRPMGSALRGASSCSPACHCAARRRLQV
jgi:hypothetical protein